MQTSKDRSSWIPRNVLAALLVSGAVVLSVVLMEALCLFLLVQLPHFLPCTPSLSVFISLLWNCTFLSTDAAYAALTAFPLSLWPFDYHLLRDSGWSTMIFSGLCFVALLVRLISLSRSLIGGHHYWLLQPYLLFLLLSHELGLYLSFSPLIKSIHVVSLQFEKRKSWSSL